MNRQPLDLSKLLVPDAKAAEVEPAPAVTRPHCKKHPNFYDSDCPKCADEAEGIGARTAASKLPMCGAAHVEGEGPGAVTYLCVMPRRHRTDHANFFRQWPLTAEERADFPCACWPPGKPCEVCPRHFGVLVGGRAQALPFDIKNEGCDVVDRVEQGQIGCNATSMLASVACPGLEGGDEHNDACRVATRAAQKAVQRFAARLYLDARKATQ